MIVTLFGGLKFLCKMLPVREFNSKFIFGQTNLIVDAIKNAGGNNMFVICDGNRVNQGFFKMFNKILPWPASNK